MQINKIGMKTIIRVEHLDGLGMFQEKPRILDRIDRSKHTVRFILPDLGKRHNRFNSPKNDNLSTDLNDKNWFCAYKSIDQIQQWVMKKEFKILFNNNYKILLLDVTEYQEGRDQIMYTKESILNSKDISNLFKL